MIGILLAATIGMAGGIALSRGVAAHARRAEPDGRALVALSYELWNLARDEGKASVEAHAAAWQTSALFARFPSIASDEVVRAFLVDAILLLDDRDARDDLERMIDVALRFHRKTPPPGDRTAARRRERTLVAIRRGVRAMRRTTTPMRPTPARPAEKLARAMYA